MLGEAFALQRWSKADPRLRNAHFAQYVQSGHGPPRCELITSVAKRSVEIDVLVAVALGLTLESSARFTESSSPSCGRTSRIPGTTARAHRLHVEGAAGRRFRGQSGRRSAYDYRHGDPHDR